MPKGAPATPHDLATFVALWIHKLANIRAGETEILHYLLTDSITDPAKYRPLEKIMGNSLHNKIRLGRPAVLHTRGMQVLLVIAAFASIGAVWLLLRALN